MATVIQTDGSSGTVWPKISIISNVVAGNSIIMAMIQDSDAASVSFSVSDAVNGAYGSPDIIAHDAGVAKSVAIFHKHSSAAAASLTITAQGENGTFGQMIVFEVSGLGSQGALATGSQANGSGTAHVSSSSALSGVGLSVCAIGEASDVAHTPGSGYTNRDGAFNRDWAQYKVGTISDSGDFTTGSAVTSLAAMAVFSVPRFNLVRP